MNKDLIVKKTLIAGAVAVVSLASGSAFAQSYVGVDLGESHASRGCAAAEATGGITSCDENDFAWKLTGGYQLPGTPFAGELTYFDLGKFKGSGTSTTADTKDSYWGLGGAYRPDFGGGWGGVARLGAAYGTSKVDYSLASIAGDHSKTGWHPYYGLGVNYAIAKNVKIEADWDNTRITSQVPSFSSTTNVVNSYTIGASLGF